eukprot:7133-Heterococcus_DN1.PRE.1
MQHSTSKNRAKLTVRLKESKHSQEGRCDLIHMRVQVLAPPSAYVRQLMFDGGAALQLSTNHFSTVAAQQYCCDAGVDAPVVHLCAYALF